MRENDVPHTWSMSPNIVSESLCLRRIMENYTKPHLSRLIRIQCENEGTISFI